MGIEVAVSVESSATFHHIGKPVPLESLEGRKGVKYSPLFDMYSFNTSNNLEIPIELHAFGPNCSLDPLVQREAHVAFKVNNIEISLKNKNIVMPLYQPFTGYKCAIILLNGQLLELIETTLSEKEIWGNTILENSILYPDFDQITKTKTCIKK